VLATLATGEAPHEVATTHDGRFAVVAGGRPSVTHYDTLEAFRAASLTEIILETGRTHQIRVHMAAIRHPCVGDRLYGADPVLAARLGLGRVLGWSLVLFPLSLIMVIPFVWMVVTSFMTDAEINRFPPTIVPHHLFLGGYTAVLADSDFPRWFWNTSIVALSAVVSQLVMCSLAGYAFARIGFTGKRLLFPLLLALPSWLGIDSYLGHRVVVSLIGTAAVVVGRACGVALTVGCGDDTRTSIRNDSRSPT